MSKQATLERRRAERVARERAEHERATRTRRLWRLGAVAAAAAVLVAGAIAVSSRGGAKPEPPASTSSLLAGIPERGGVLGDPEAPLTVTEYVDLQCPVCAEAARSTLPALIRDQVRTGKVKLAVRTLHFLGPDSERAARVAAGAERQGRLWAFLEAFYARQGTENSGYVTDGFLREVARGRGRRRRTRRSARRTRRSPRSGSSARTPTRPGWASRARRRSPSRRGERRGAHAEASPLDAAAGPGRAGGGPMRAAAIGVALAGLGIATYLTVVHYAGGEPVCAIAHGCAIVQRRTTRSSRACPWPCWGCSGTSACSLRWSATARRPGPPRRSSRWPASGSPSG